MRIYLDNCCFNRPFDDQTQLKISLETQAKIQIQKEIKQGKHELIWSSMLDYENRVNPFDVRKNSIAPWRNIASRVIMIKEAPSIITNAEEFVKQGLHRKDALHCACAQYAECDCLLTVDNRFLKVKVDNMKVMSPIEFINMEADSIEEG